MAMDAFPVSQLPEEHNVILVISTTGQASTGLCVHYEQTMLLEHSSQLSHFADQGEVPSNMKAFWKFLLRKALPADSLKGVTVAVFGLGDSGVLSHARSCPLLLCTASYTCLLTHTPKQALTVLKMSRHAGYQNYNTVAKKLDRRLTALGASVVSERGLGDDQHPNGYEAALDPWLQKLWSQLRAKYPLQLGLSEVHSQSASLHAV